MTLATDDTAICVPHEKYHPGSQELYEVCVASLQRGFKRPDGTEGFTTKGLTTSFTGVSIDQSVPGEIILDMCKCATDIVKKHGFLDAHAAPAPGMPGRVLTETDCAFPLAMRTHQTALLSGHASVAVSGSLAVLFLLHSIMSPSWLA
jgi:hypothetical protein